MSGARPDPLGEAIARLQRGRPLPDMERRRQATQATFDKFRRKPFAWETGATCLHLARFHLRQMGHTVPKVPEFRSALGARRALEKTGFASVTALLDSLLERRPAPAFMRLGDLVVLPGDAGFDAVMVCGGHKAFGWLAGADEEGMTTIDLEANWHGTVPENDEAPELAGRRLAELAVVFET